MGLWDYEENVQDYEDGETSSSSCVTESDEEDGKSKKRGKKHSRKQPQKTSGIKRPFPPETSLTPADDDPLDFDGPITLSDSDDEFIAANIKKPTISKVEPTRAFSLTPEADSPEDTQDDETRRKLQHIKEGLKKLEETVNQPLSEPDISPEPAPRIYARWQPTALFTTSSPSPVGQAPEQPVVPCASLPSAPSTAPQEEVAVDDSEKIILTLQSKAFKVKLRCITTKPLSRLFSTFQAHAEKQGWIQPGQAFRLIFDGDEIDPDQNADSYGMEDDDSIDVQF